jgi:hypothetical protein
VTTESLPGRDVARSVLRLAFPIAWTVGSLLAMAIVFTVANAAAAVGVPVEEPTACTRLDDDRARLACFDALFPRGGRRAATSAIPSAAPGAAPPATAPESMFGVNDNVRRARGETLATDAMPEMIESTVARLDPLEPGRNRITLANGQVWEQVEASTRFQPRAGEAVTVRQASLGSYLMRASRGAAVRARRLR